jgi:anti-anti-sigma factor
MPLEKWSDSTVLVHLADDPQFTDDMDAVLSLNPPASAVLDFGAVHYVNSSNIAKLLHLRRTLASAGVKLVLCGISNQVWSAMLLTGLDKIFEVAENVPTALATLQINESRKPSK